MPAIKAFEISQSLRGKWLMADDSLKRRYLAIVFLNFVLDDATLVPTTRKPFEFLAEGLLVSSSRGECASFEPTGELVAVYVAEAMESQITNLHPLLHGT